MPPSRPLPEGNAPHAHGATAGSVSLVVRWRRGIASRSLPTLIAAALAWAVMAYMLMMALVAALYTRPTDGVVAGPVYVISRPMDFYYDTHDLLGVGLDVALLIFCLFGGWILLSPFIPKRRKQALPPEKIRPPGPVVLGEAPPVLDDDFRESRLLEKRDSSEPSELPEQIRRMITRFVDIRTLQPRGVLRSVIILLHSDIEAYRHLLRTGECLQSLEKLRRMPPDIFNTAECREMLVEEGYENAFSQLGLRFGELIPALIERIEGQLDESVVRVSRAVAESTSSLGISWYVQHLVTRFIDLRTLQPVGILRSVLILLNSNIASYHQLLKSPECRASIDRLNSLPPDVFDTEDCRELLGRKKYAELFNRLNLPPSRLVPTLIERIESDRSDSPMSLS